MRETERRDFCQMCLCWQCFFCETEAFPQARNANASVDFPASANLFSCGAEKLFSISETLCSVRPSVKTLFSYE